MRNFLILFVCVAGSVVSSVQEHCGQSLPDLGLDEALVTMSATGHAMGDHDHDVTFKLMYQTDVCYQCAMLEVLHMKATENCTTVVSTQHCVLLNVVASRPSPQNHSQTEHWDVCSLKDMPSNQGWYWLYVRYALEHHSNSTYMNATCSFIQLDEPADTYIPIYVAGAILMASAAIWILIKLVYRKEYHKKILTLINRGYTERIVNQDLGSNDSVTKMEPEQSTSGDGSGQAPAPPRQRLRSLDAFRGMSLVIMIFVNYGGGGYWFFDHSAWNGLTVADLVMPWFTWIMGTSIALAFTAQRRRNVAVRSMLYKIFKRTIILFMIGIALENNGPDPISVSTLRYPGVLQRLAACYCIIALMELSLGNLFKNSTRLQWAPMRDILPYWPMWLIALCMVITWVCLTFLLPLPYNCPTGYLGPGGLADNGKYPNCTGGAARVIDTWFFGDAHIYQSPTCKEVYQTLSHDPEGILGTLTMTFMVFLGLQAGKTFLAYEQWRSRCLRFIIWSVVCGIIAAILCQVKQNGGWIPVNKNLWTISFVLALSSGAFFLLMIFYVLIDVTKIWTGAPFVYPGMNSIVVYTCHITYQNFFPVQWSVPHTHASLLAVHMWGVSLWVVMAYWLYHLKFFVAI